MRKCVVCGVGGMRRGVAWGVRSPELVGMAASRFWRTRFRRARASGAGDAVNDKYEKENRDCERATIQEGFSSIPTWIG